MSAEKTTTKFGAWLREEIAARHAVDPNYGVRTLARQLAEEHPEGANPRTIESARSTLKRYLRGDSVPLPRMRHTLADKLGVDESEMPDDDVAEDAVSAITREARTANRRVELFKESA